MEAVCSSRDLHLQHLNAGDPDILRVYAGDLHVL